MDTPQDNANPATTPTEATNRETRYSSPAEIELKRLKDQKGSLQLVLVMLGILAGLCVVIMLLPLAAGLVKQTDPQTRPDHFESLLEFSKWSIAVMLGAFGAWIGAGAAYFFGKENLAESSRSTEQALRIQQEALRPKPVERIRDMPLTPVNPAFMFGLTETKKSVIDKLNSFRGYWFVPVIENTGALKDIIHARVFWQSETPDSDLPGILQFLKDPKYNDLHGAAFYTTVSLNDKVMDVYESVKRKSVEVVIVEDNGKPAHCISKTDLTSFLKCANRI